MTNTTNHHDAYNSFVMYDLLNAKGYFDKCEIDEIDRVWNSACDHYNRYVQSEFFHDLPHNYRASEYKCMLEYVRNVMELLNDENDD